ncbi:phosphoribosylanthranilate isomerase [Dysgonomonas sp. 25]|uniref:phosphoribosylanthranilate isomerase n=1 Tax=Dysgonomonas sp. 25 TaxID=2302933 RepID=UPI0013D07F7C|nr:phosphoribosylanthranilate isomerase [Dysgonomonas sp. 25]NDV69191.1 phosphoribosylanthranilate isomerase [Dysgonomonas sp. 25]
MRIKVCGMREPDNIEELAELPIDMMGLIFYEKSPRYVGNISKSNRQAIGKATTEQGIDRVGVFVDESLMTILQAVDSYMLDMVQLHGDESPDFCRELNKTLPVIKAFSIAEAADLEQTTAYEGLFGYFLFDTKTPQRGGSGQQFDWTLLDRYTGRTPFLLSGGISVDDAAAIRAIKHPKFYGVDLNSRFEVEPGLKDIRLLEQFIKALKQ